MKGINIDLHRLTAKNIGMLTLLGVVALLFATSYFFIQHGFNQMERLERENTALSEKVFELQLENKDLKHQDRIDSIERYYKNKEHDNLKNYQQNVYSLKAKHRPQAKIDQLINKLTFDYSHIDLGTQHPEDFKYSGAYREKMALYNQLYQLLEQEGKTEQYQRFLIDIRGRFNSINLSNVSDKYPELFDK